MIDGVHEGSFEPNRPASYNKDEVDAFIDLVEQEMARVVDENHDLKAIVTDQAAVIAQLRAELGKG
ncbi:DivIVA domain-containing protein [Nocardia sp. CDC159]|uniref:DivIVA domain-containing protein n=1 Tax=Nocardia pulmonis TaxID=2951408 RepID=A0A9X2IZ24_9NOCA|nr:MULTISPECIES: DivIVA domain-containing protein [Nocardia]MCM6774491.1 DivIVA domain-containing protein [Nocardia pulmonis]MCM6787443.1 DivIVA domain-containing protein [Nocardia sp. CDC159]